MEFKYIEAAILASICLVCFTHNKQISEFILRRQAPYLKIFFGRLFNVDSIWTYRMCRAWLYLFGTFAGIAAYGSLFGPMS
jgi:hypothetical protein